MINIDNKLTYSEIESKRFNLNIHRLNTNELNVKVVQNYILKNLIDTLIIRIPSTENVQIQELSRLGFEYIQADTLVYYELNLLKHENKILKNQNLTFRKATKDDTNIIDYLVKKIFNRYTNHYYSNKYLKQDDTLDGYSEWVLNYIDCENKIVFIVYRDETPIGFASCSFDTLSAEGVLYGILDEHSGGGVYTDIIRHTANYFKQKGLEKMYVSTQIQNYAVQKVWNREGYFLSSSYITIHLNPLLNFSVEKERTFNFECKFEDILNYGNISKDKNSIHFNDNTAISLGFESKIAHALLIEGEISRFLGVEYPGDRTLILNNSNIFYKPIYPDHNYKIKMTVPFKTDNGFYLILFKVYDKKENLVALLYNNTFKK